MSENWWAFVKIDNIWIQIFVTDIYGITMHCLSSQNFCSWMRMQTGVNQLTISFMWATEHMSPNLWLDLETQTGLSELSQWLIHTVSLSSGGLKSVSKFFLLCTTISFHKIPKNLLCWRSLSPILARVCQRVLNVHIDDHTWCNHTYFFFSANQAKAHRRRASETSPDLQH